MILIAPRILTQQLDLAGEPFGQSIVEWTIDGAKVSQLD